MRSLARIPVLFIVLLVVHAPVTAATSRETLPPATNPGDIQVFNVSLKLVKCTENTSCTGEWKDYFKRLADKGYKPDVLSVLEVPHAKRDAVVAELAAAMNTPTGAWNIVHSDKDVTCPDLMKCGNSMIVYRAPKFAQVEPYRFHRHEMIQTPTGADCLQNAGDYTGSRDVAVKLQEKDSAGIPIAGRTVVTAAIHLPPSLNMECVRKSSGWIRNHLANKNGDMTIVTGDFNRTASGDGFGDTETEYERRESCPVPWYKEWSLPQATPDPACASGFTGEYRDAVRQMHSNICTEWTVWNQVAEADPGVCKKDGKRRIDFVWVRRVVGGVVVEPTILSAETDRGYYTNADDWAGRYSDHRALEALLRF